jgi:hypothetical protein
VLLVLGFSPDVGSARLIGIYWYPLHASSAAATICFAVAIGCLANWFRNRTLHCAITGPLFLIAGIMFLFAEIGTLAINARFVWPIVAIVTGIAFLMEWRGAPLEPLRRNAPERSQWRPIFLFRLPGPERLALPLRGWPRPTDPLIDLIY